MRYYGEEALGMIETLGMVPAIYGCDLMLKAAEVDLVAYENIGSTLVTVLVKGEVAACTSAVEAGRKGAAEIGTLTASGVLPRPDRFVGDIVSCHDVDESHVEGKTDDRHGESSEIKADDPLKNITGLRRYNALGLIETYGLVFVLHAADAMVKAADVKLIGYANTASGYISVLVSGEVSACEAAVAAGVKIVEDMDGKLYSHVVIARPHQDIYRIIDRYDPDIILGSDGH